MTDKQLAAYMGNTIKLIQLACDESERRLKDAGVGKERKNMLGLSYHHIEEFDPIREALSSLWDDIEMLEGKKQ